MYTLRNSTAFISVDDETRDEIKFLVKQYVDASERTCLTRTDWSLHHILNKLSQNSAIKEYKYDNGNGIAVLDSSDCYSKLEKIVGGKKTFTLIEYNSKVQQHLMITKENLITYYNAIIVRG